MEKIYKPTWRYVKTLDSITISNPTTSLNRGDSFSFGGTVTAHYDNGTIANVTSEATFSGYNMNLGGTYTVTVSYTENGVIETATYSLTVNKVWSIIFSDTSSCAYTCNDNPGTFVRVGDQIIIVPDTGNIVTQTFRITFSVDSSGTNGATTYSYPGSGGTTSVMPTSPVTTTVTSEGAARGAVILAVMREYLSNGAKANLYFIYNTPHNTSQNKYFSYHGYNSNNYIGPETVKITITQIERYY